MMMMTRRVRTKRRGREEDCMATQSEEVFIGVGELERQRWTQTIA